MNTNKSNGQLTAQIAMSDYKKSGFDLSNNVFGTGKIGRIIPTRALHVMPGDSIKADSKVAVQFEPLAVPILANMEVKQEHFYVPYNVVWKNWDKFISGGEKMNYEGVVPNISMTRIVDTLLAIFSKHTDDGVVFPLSLIGGSSGVPFNFVEFDVQEWLTNRQVICENKLNSIGYTYSVKDLLKPQYEVLKLITAYVNDLQDNIQLIRKGVPGEYVYGTNKYMDDINEALLEMEPYFIPTEQGIEFLKLIYEFYKPFIGYGSNIDYLNMARLSFSDFLYMFICEVIKMYDHGFSGSIGYCLSSDKCSEDPMTILHLRANYSIWYNNYRDILLEEGALEPVDDDSITDDELFTLLIPRQRCWEKDMFTTALDNPGTGNVGVAVGANSLSYGNYDVFTQDVNSNGDATADGTNIYKVAFDGEYFSIPTSFLAGINSQQSDINVSVPGFSLYQLEAAQRAQKWLQKALFFGNRISDFYYMRFGVRFLDARLRLPELLTSSSELVKLDVVMNNTNITTEAGGKVYNTIAGDRAAYASAYDNGNSFDRFCEEHGVIMSYLTIMPQVTYAYGMCRDYSRIDQFDYAFSEFATLGMDAVYDSEITATSVISPFASSLKSDIHVFGYQGKYYDYKAKHSEEHGELLDSQDMYSFSRKFNMLSSTGRPSLNYEFVHCFPDLDMFVVDSSLSDYFRYDIRHSTAAERNLPSQSLYI